MNNSNSSNRVEEDSNYNISAKEIVQHYKKMETSITDTVQDMSIQKFLQGLVSNRVLDLYLKYMGITMLTTSTLVPLALILGAKHFEEAVDYVKQSDQVGGKFLENKIPVLDDDLIGNYLKLSGLTLLNVSPNTLIPLGILMYIYRMYETQHDDGETDNETQSPLSENTTEQEGGSIASIPPNLFQRVDSFINGQNQVDFDRSIPYYNNDMQLENTNISGNFVIPNTNLPVQVDGFPSNGIPSTTVNNSTIMTDTPIQNNQNPQLGGGSDWWSSQMSRGAYNSPGQDPNQFKLFTPASDYISNKVLSSGAADHWQSSPGTIHTTLYQQTPANSPPTGYNINGVPTSQFGGSTKI